MLAEAHPRAHERLSALNMFDTPNEASFNTLAQLAADLCDTPIAVISLLDGDRQWILAEVGLGSRETPIDELICDHALLGDRLTVIPDTLADWRSRDKAICRSGTGVRFYASALLQEVSGLPIGTLCVLDTKPRDLTPRQRRGLVGLADQVIATFKLKRELETAQQLRAEVDHRLKNSLSLVASLLGQQARLTGSAVARQSLVMARDRVQAIAVVHDQLYRSPAPGTVDLGSFLGQLCGSISAQARPDQVITADAPAEQVPTNLTMNLGIVVNELVTNALRHAFPDNRGGSIVVSAEVRGQQIHVRVTDNGKGLDADFDPHASTGLGMRLAFALPRQLGGGTTWRSRPGETVFEFELPLNQTASVSGK